MKRELILFVGGVLLLGGSAAAASGELAASAVLKDSASPFGRLPAVERQSAGVDMPNLSFTETAADRNDYDKYYAFSRANTDFGTAYGDLLECDGYARGLATSYHYVDTPYPYAGTLSGVLGGALGNVMVQAIFGSAEKRRMRRVNMRMCMNLKGYDRYGLSKEVWQTFNFEEGLSDKSDERRRSMLRQQALVASSGKLRGKVLGQ